GLARAIHQRPADLAEAAMVLVDRDLALLLDRAGEEPAGDGDRAVDDRLRHAVVGEIEEAEIGARLMDPPGGLTRRLRVASAHPGEIDDRQGATRKRGSPFIHTAIEDRCHRGPARRRRSAAMPPD